MVKYSRTHRDRARVTQLSTQAKKSVLELSIQALLTRGNIDGQVDLGQKLTSSAAGASPSAASGAGTSSSFLVFGLASPAFLDPAQPMLIFFVSL